MLTSKEAAARLGITRQHLSHLLRDAGRQKTGRDWILTEADLAELAERPTKPGWPAGRPRKKARRARKTA